jgi:putative membrane-bound dehydrogenase-like protein
MIGNERMRRPTLLLSLASVVVCALGASVRGGAIGQLPATQSATNLRAAPGLEVTLWASEPAISNPTNIAVDERGRVWVLEAVNYRRLSRNQPDLRPEGDRIVILEDTNGDGTADATKVFDQGPHIRAPLGIAVLGDRVIVSQSPDLIVYTKDARDRIVKREVLLTGWGGVDHDHGLHAAVFGPDGRYYFNAGNEGYDVTDRSGHRVRAPRAAGLTATSPDWTDGSFYEGAAMVVNPDGTGLRVLAQNFRNPYELAIDAFGDIWQTDNDDDGNAWTRANYVMEGGNYGYRGPRGRRWQDDAGSHFHEELPGVAPNLLRLGPGSPCGLLVYEGKLLPEAYRGHLLHAEAGRRVIAHYPLTVAGAGYETRIDEIVFGGDDTWFRPTDVAVAPDGAVYVADWYDSSVGGHGMGDAQGARGRIYRLAPSGYKSRKPPMVDLKSDEGLTAAFASPAQSVFYLAHSELVRRGPAALPLLTAMWKGSDPIVRARALWLLGDIEAGGTRYVEDGLRDPDARFRMLALRVLRRHTTDVVALTRPLLRDPSAQVRREIAIILQDPARMAPAYVIGAQTPPAPGVLDALVELAKQYDGQDRWYLAALGMAARGREDALYERLRADNPGLTPAFAQLLRELRAPASLSPMIAVLQDQARPVADRLGAMEVLAVMESTEAARAVTGLLAADGTPAPLVERAFAHVRRQLFSLWADSRKIPEFAAAIRKALRTPGLQAGGVDLASAVGDPQFGPDLLALARSSSADEAVRAAAVDVVALNRAAVSLDDLDELLKSGPPAVRVSAMHAIGLRAPSDLEARAEAVLFGDAPNEVRSQAVRVLARTPAGIDRLIAMEQAGKFPPELKRLATNALQPPLTRVFRNVTGSATRPGPAGDAPTPDAAAAAALAAARERAAKVFPPLKTGKAPVPTVREMEQNFRADAAAGRKVFDTLCSACHSLGGARQIGPDLSTIGGKLDRQALLDAIVMPSAAIGFGYESWTMETTTNGTVSGLLVQDTADQVVLKVDATQEIRLAPSAIKSRRQIPISIMPEGLLDAMTPQQIVDLVGFLTTLKTVTAASR